MDKRLLTNARIVTPDAIVHGTLVLDEEGHIAGIETGIFNGPDALDCEGDYLVPGLVELHTDNLEKHFSPRPGVTWPGRSAVIAHDSQIVASGITTVFDALSLGDIMDGSSRLQNLQAMVDALQAASRDGLYRTNHLLHLRCEVSCESALGLFEALVDHPSVRLVSIMDHSPGQRQFAKPEKYRQYYQGKYGLSDAELEAFIKKQVEASARYSARYRDAIARMCDERQLPMASHDDATREHVEESAAYRMQVAEFPTTLEAAHLSHASGLRVLMGAPNVVRGGSHSGNVAAADLAAEGVLDILSSDYYPSSLLDAAFKLSELENDYDLPAAIRTVAQTPAEAVGLMDRGAIEPGRRGDLVWVRYGADKHPHIRHVWNQGRRVF